jgi:hypothetical protein
VLALAAAATAGCATFSDSDAVARVGDVELSSDEFATRVAQIEQAQGLLPSVDERFRIDGDTARVVVSNWVALRLAAEQGVLERYANGIGDLPVACVFVLQTTDDASAAALVAELEGGADWTDVATREAPDVPAAGRQQCLSTDTLPPELAAQLTGMSPSDPYRVVAGAPALVVRAQAESELLGFDLLNVVTQTDAELAAALFTASATSDVYVDPRIGTYDPADLSVVAVN